MMLTEIGIMPPEGGPKQAMLQGLIMFASFLFLGALPLIAYVVTELINERADKWTSGSITCLSAVASLFLLGVLKAKVANMPLIRGGLGMAVQGMLSAVGAFIIGTSLPGWLNLGDMN